VQLVTHLQSASASAAAGLRVTAAAEVHDHWGHFEFSIEGELADVFWPPAGASLRQDGLWQRTCFEAFVARPGSARYCEFNFAPSGAWAAYEFADYRSGMRALELPVPPLISAQMDDNHARLRARLDLAPLIGSLFAPPGAPLELELELALELALCAVIERGRGVRSYWALRHGGEQPDFHRREGFAAALAIRSPTLRQTIA
jgi:hypothetical protein